MFFFTPKSIGDGETLVALTVIIIHIYIYISNKIDINLQFIHTNNFFQQYKALSYTPHCLTLVIWTKKELSTLILI